MMSDEKIYTVQKMTGIYEGKYYISGPGFSQLDAQNRRAPKFSSQGAAQRTADLMARAYHQGDQYRAGRIRVALGITK